MVPEDFSELLVGELLKSVNYPDLPDGFVVKRSGSIKIKVLRTNQSVVWLDCPNRMFGETYVYTGEQCYQGYLNVMGLYGLSTKRTWAVPMVMLKRTGDRIIDLREIPLMSKVVDSMSMPEVEKYSLLNRLTSKGNVQTIQRNRLRWFLGDFKGQKTLKNVLCQIIRDINIHGCVSCICCGYGMGPKYIKEHGYTRNAKVYIKCRACRQKLMLILCPPEQIKTSPYLIKSALV